MSAADLARVEQISPQAVGTTLAALEQRGLVERRPDPGDGRRVVLSVSESGVEVLRHQRDERSQHLAKVLAQGFTEAELEALMVAAPLIERLGEHL